MLSWTRVWSPNLITESRIAFARLVTSRVQANATKDLKGIWHWGIANFLRPQWRVAD